ncbi:MAG: preprotein translocase subunit YajC [Phenylobacterium sp.]
MFATPAFAQAAGAATGGGPQDMLIQFLPLIGLVVLFYFLMIRPQQQRMKKHRATIDALKKGDTVVTGGGLIGKVTKVEGDTVEIEIATGVKVKAVKSTLSDITPLGGTKPAND